MIRLARDKRRNFAWLLVLTSVVMFLMSYFGFRFKGFRPENNVQWSDSSLGLTFKRFSMAFTDGFFSPTGRCLTMEFAIEPEFTRDSGFQCFLLIHDGRDEQQLVVGQWHSSMIVMNGNDYGHRRRTPRIFFQMNETAGQPQLVTVVSDSSGTSVYLDGKLEKQSKDLILNFPQKVEQAKLVVGNDVYGKHPWTGKILGLSLYDRALKDGVVYQHYTLWSQKKNFNAFQSDAPQILYAFDEAKGNKVTNRVSGRFDLQVPIWMNALKKSVLSWPKIEGHHISKLYADGIINLFGFIPLGLVLMATLAQLEGVGTRSLSIAVVLLSFCYSLVIEAVQAWIPSRDSSLLDLMLNTFGSWIGIVIFIQIRKRLRAWFDRLT